MLTTSGAICNMIDNLCRHVMGFTHNHILHRVLMGQGKTTQFFPFSICASEVLNDESIGG